MRSQSASYHGYRFPPNIISHAVWLSSRFCLSFRDAEDLLAQRGRNGHLRDDSAVVPAVRSGLTPGSCGAAAVGWETPGISTRCSSRSRVASSTCGAPWMRTVTSWDILVQPRRNRPAAVRFFRRLLKNQRHVPRRLITDTLRSDSAACRAVMPSVLHCTDQYANNRAERPLINRHDSVSSRCGVSRRPLSSNGSRRFTGSCRICSESVDTSCGRLTTVCSAPARSLNGMR